MTTQSDDERTMREALEYFQYGMPNTPAKEALSRILQNTLPEIPDGWLVDQIYQHTNGWECALSSIKDDNLIVEDTGKSPREAISNAIEKIK